MSILANKIESITFDIEAIISGNEIIKEASKNLKELIDAKNELLKGNKIDIKPNVDTSGLKEFERSESQRH